MSHKQKIDKRDIVHVQIVEKPSEFTKKKKKNPDPHDITLPAVIVFGGSSGSGKTYMCIKLMKHFETKSYITRTFLLCPTLQLNNFYHNLKTLKDVDSYTDEKRCPKVIAHILKQVKEDWKE